MSLKTVKNTNHSFPERSLCYSLCLTIQPSLPQVAPLVLLL